MNASFIIAILLAAALPCAVASELQPTQTETSPFSVEASVAYVHVSGVRQGPAGVGIGPVRTKNDTSSLAAPSLRVGYELDESWNLGLGYAYYDEIEQSGTYGGFALEIWGKERIHEVTFDARYSLRIDERFSIQGGPVASLFFSRVDYRLQGSGLPWIFREENNARLGIGAAVTFKAKMTERLSATLGYRLAFPKDHTFNSVSLGLSYRI